MSTRGAAYGGTSGGVRAYRDELAAQLREVRPRLPDGPDAVPVAVAGAIVAGMAFALAITPVGSGDYGQWLMTSRAVLGESVPAYRDLSEVPPLVPMLLGAARAVVGDPIVALHVVSTILLVGLGTAFVALGTLVTGSRWGGPIALFIGLLLTDRFTNLFAFGGLLQLAATVSATLAVAAIVRGARDPLGARRWAWLAVAGLGLSILTHVGTALIAVPVGLGLAAMVALSAFARARWDLDRVRSRLLWPAAGFAAVAVAWLVMVVPAGGDYVSNPASLAYRGPERLWGDLLDRWPTAVVVVVGAGALLLGALHSALGRRLDGVVLVAAWSAITWALVAWALLTGSATDYPRFATPILAPLVIGSTVAVLWGLRSLASSFAEVGFRWPVGLVAGAAVVSATLVAAPLAIDRHVRQAEFYELRDPDALAAAATWIDGRLPAGTTVLAEVREAKWIEGLVGRPALFSQSVRYAFRPQEWQRSVDADAILRSTAALTSGFIGASFTDAVATGDAVSGDAASAAVPTGLVIQANHGGELIELVRIQPSHVTIDSVHGAQLDPVRAVGTVDDRQASLRTVWSLADVPNFSFTQTVTAFVDGTTLRVVQVAPGHHVTTRLTEVFGMEMQVVELYDDSARICFREIGSGPPCLELRTTDGEGRLSESADGGVLVSSDRSGQIELLVTALTAGEAPVGLGLLDPARLVAEHGVRAAVLAEADPAYAARARRLQALGFEPSRRFGPYRVLIREDESAPRGALP